MPVFIIDLNDLGTLALLGAAGLFLVILLTKAITWYRSARRWERNYNVTREIGTNTYSQLVSAKEEVKMVREQLREVSPPSTFHADDDSEDEKGGTYERYWWDKCDELQAELLKATASSNLWHGRFESLNQAYAHYREFATKQLRFLHYASNEDAATAAHED